ncbi:hypothetical protein [Qipengyuania nanhaisediminis]|uniref:Uncharacterized protein n=1 Tax=Qipengyuania nanhaisediminis TaxID=604088 RepID=A0A1I5NT45_9SPHN|nr:hypothetical protein [Qipengyuania nanhaisediminis]SFP24998.1 hypothetical protein SAMN04488060_2080 [Qipengyuania nanhaisediminis]
MQRLTPYLFFTLAVAGLVWIAIRGDAGFDEEVDPLTAVIVVAGVFLAAHALRHLAARLFRKTDGKD